MEKNQYQSLLRILYRYQTDILLVTENGSIRGVVNKHILEEQMSDLSHIRSGFAMPISPAEMEDILTAILKSNVIENGQRVIPVIDTEGKFLALWNKTQILKASHTEVPEKYAREENPAPKNQEERHYNDVPKDFSFKSSASPEISENKVQTKEKSSENSDFNSAEFISIKTLESLPIPMLALDTKGDVLFYNQDWVSLQKENRESLGIKKLMSTAKDIMAKLAFDGELEITSVLELPFKIKEHNLKMRSILDNSQSRPEVIGYIFWAESIKIEIVEKEVLKEIPVETKKKKGKDNSRHEITPETGVSDSSKYMGKTLVELLREEEKKILSWAMEEAGNNQSNAAMLLGIPRQTFSFRYNKIFSNKMSSKLK